QGEVRLWDVNTAQRIGQPIHHGRGSVWQAVFSPDGKRILTAGDDQTARLWDASTTRQIGSALLHPASVVRVAFSPDGATFVTQTQMGEIQARLWRTADSRPIGQPIPCGAHALFSPDSKLLLTEDPWHWNTLRFWEVASGKPVGQPMPHAGNR